MTSLVQSASATWARGSQGTPSTIILPSAATVGGVVIIETSYSGDVIDSVSGLGATWNVVRSREGSNNDFEAAEIWYATVVTAATTITVTPNPSFTINSGKAVAREYAGLTGSVGSSNTVGTHSGGTTQATVGLAASTGDVYVGVITQGLTSSAPTVTENPASFTALESSHSSYGGGTPDSWMVSGPRIAAGSESPSLSAAFSSFQNGVAVSAVFTAVSTGLTVAVPSPFAVTVAMVATPTVTLSGGDLVVAVPGPLAFTVAIHAPVVKLTPTFAGYDLDDNNSQALNISVQMSAVLEVDPIPTSLAGHTDAQLRALRRSLTMPTPTLDGRGRPT